MYLRYANQYTPNSGVLAQHVYSENGGEHKQYTKRGIIECRARLINIT